MLLGPKAQRSKEYFREEHDEGGRWAVGDSRFPRPFNSLRLYNLCRMFDFSFLPEEGGLLDQDAQLLDDWRVIREIDIEGQTEKE